MIYSINRQKIIWDGDKFLIYQRPAHKARGLLWKCVGGKVEPGEMKEHQRNFFGILSERNMACAALVCGCVNHVSLGAIKET